MLQRFVSVAALLLSSWTFAKNIDDQLQDVIQQQQLNQPFIADLPQSSLNPNIVELGGELFFSPDLSIDGSVSCASCHHPKKAGGDGIALPIGIGGVDSENIGQARINAAQNNIDAHIAEGFIPRNTPTVFNASLYRQTMFWDGRIEYVTTDKGRMIKAGFGLSPYSPTPYAQNSLLQTQARMPLTSVFEMKGWLAPHKNNHEIEQSVVEFLQSNERWCKAFALRFPKKSCDKSISLETITQALAEYQASLVFTNSPFERYVQGDKQAINELQKQGALLFFTPLDKGGLGCVACHSSKHFSDEKFYALPIPASGRGANEHGWDFGRHNVDAAAPRFTFRVPSLLNISETGPYMHNGVASSLQAAVELHIANQRQPKPKDLHIVELANIDYYGINLAIESELYGGMGESLKRLPKSIDSQQMQALLSFLNALTDDCLRDDACINDLLRPVVESPRKPEKSAQRFPDNAVRKLDVTQLKAPVIHCKKAMPDSEKSGNGKKGFSFSSLALPHKRHVGLVRKGWLLDVVNYGGVSAVDVNGDCLDDLIFDAGTQGLKFYLQTPKGFKSQAIPHEALAGAVTPLIMDVDGDYKYDLFVGNDGQNPAYLVFDFQHNRERYYFNELTGPVINAAITDLDADGDMDFSLAFWRSFKSLHQEHIWETDGQGNVSAREKIQLRKSYNDVTGGTDDMIRRKHETPFSESDMTFTPNFADIDNDGDPDLLLAADFNRSQILRNDGGQLVDITDKQVITDNNGMGAAVLDIDNQQLPSWFVTSIHRGKGTHATGNHLYVNENGQTFSKSEASVPVVDKEWSWGACAADFNNDGYTDLFYVSGFGEMLKTATYESEAQKKASLEFLKSNAVFAKPSPKLLMNNQRGGFVDVSETVGLGDAFPGRGIACFDYQQDGDIDIVVAPVEGVPKVFINHLNGDKHWLALRLIGPVGNSEAFGAKVVLETEQGKQYREVRFENNYISRNPAQLHFGLGDLKQVKRMTITFAKPHAKTIVLDDPTINRLHLVYHSDDKAGK